MKRFLHIILVIILFVSCNQKSRKNDDAAIGVENEFISDSILYMDSIMPLGDTINGEVYFIIIEDMPTFGNGDQDLFDYILANTEYPQTAIDDSIQGKVYIQLVINEDGSVSDAKVMRGLRYDIDQECIRVIENMPKWEPGKQRGKPVKTRYTIPFSFRLKTNSINGHSITPKIRMKSPDFKLYPNPISDVANIDIQDFKDDLEYQIINTKGQIIKSGQFYSKIEQINVSDLENGLYVFRLISKNDGVIKTQKIIKK